MMKKSLTILIAFGSLAFLACSSLGVSDSEAIEGNYPAGFTAAEYMALHPQLGTLQRQEYVTAYNKALSLEAEAIAADSIAFFEDTASLHQIYVNYAGYSEALWAEDWSSSVSIDTVCALDTISLRLRLADLTQITVFVDDISYDLTGAISSVVGYRAPDSNKTGTPETFVIDGVAATVIIQQGSPRTVVDSTNCRAEETISLGEIPKDKKKYLQRYNFKDILTDLSALAAIPLDSEEISLQYLMFGKSHGWAYRVCSAEEKNNPIQTETYPAVKLYCEDEGIVREIAE